MKQRYLTVSRQRSMLDCTRSSVEKYGTEEWREGLTGCLGGETHTEEAHTNFHGGDLPAPLLGIERKTLLDNLTALRLYLSTVNRHTVCFVSRAPHLSPYLPLASQQWTQQTLPPSSTRSRSRVKDWSDMRKCLSMSPRSSLRYYRWYQN